MKLLLISFLLVVSTVCQSQELNLKNDYSGMFSVGSRSTFSLFNDVDHSSIGMGIGGQFRLQFTDNLNTEWFFDYLSSNLNDLIDRKDFHIGWSVMYYMMNRNDKLLNPYLAAGHCFDQTFLYPVSNDSFKRFSSAVQAGLGTNINVHHRWDITVLCQYMIHLGKEIEPIFNNGNVTFQTNPKSGLEGHILLTLGINYKIKDLW